MGSTGYYFQGSGEQPHRSRDLGSPAESKKKNLHLKGKAYISLDFFLKKNPVYIDGSYRSNTIVNTEYHRTQNRISL